MDRHGERQKIIDILCKHLLKDKDFIQSNLINIWNFSEEILSLTEQDKGMSEEEVIKKITSSWHIENCYFTQREGEERYAFDYATGKVYLKDYYLIPREVYESSNLPDKGMMSEEEIAREFYNTIMHEYLMLEKGSHILPVKYFMATLCDRKNEFAKKLLGKIPSKPSGELKDYGNFYLSSVYALSSKAVSDINKIIMNDTKPSGDIGNIILEPLTPLVTQKRIPEKLDVSFNTINSTFDILMEERKKINAIITYLGGK